MDTFAIVRDTNGALDTTVRSWSRVQGATFIENTPTGPFVRLSAAVMAFLRARGLDLDEFPDPRRLRIADHVVDVRKRRRIREKFARAHETNWRQFVAQFRSPPHEGRLRDVESRGLRITGRLGTYGLVLEGTVHDAEDLHALDGIVYVAPFAPAWRVSPAVQRRKGILRFVLVVVRPAPAAEAVAQHVQRLGGRVEATWSEDKTPGTDQRALVVEIDRARILDLARHRDVRWIDHQPAVYAVEDERSAQIVAGNLDQAAPPDTAPKTGYRQFLKSLGGGGDGVVIAICDTGVDTNTTVPLHPDLTGRIAFAPATPGAGDTDGHGTLVAAIAAGTGEAADKDPRGFSLGQGVAPAARIGVILNRALAPFEEFSAESVRKGAAILNCSWGLNGAGDPYSMRDAAVDLAVRDGDPSSGAATPLSVVFSSGNEPVAGMLTKQAKNAIVVGSTFSHRPDDWFAPDVRLVDPDSAHGPAKDGRRLPTVVAPGTAIVSARSTVPTTTPPGRPRDAYVDSKGAVHEDHYCGRGTSFAAPHVAGVCALLIEWWRTTRQTAQAPSPAMLKALIVNGAEDCVGGTRSGVAFGHAPDAIQGWGRVHIRNIVERSPKICFDQHHPFVSCGEEFSVEVTVADPARPLRVTLAWTDHPGTMGSEKALVNDLDLEVTGLTSGQSYLGNVFSGAWSVPGGTRDDLDTVECVFVREPVGRYVVAVRATHITMNARRPFDADTWQDFALVIDNASV